MSAAEELRERVIRVVLAAGREVDVNAVRAIATDLAPGLERLRAELAESERARAKLKQTIAAFPDAHQAANLAHARAQRDTLQATVERVKAVRDGWYAKPMMSDHADELDVALDGDS